MDTIAKIAETVAPAVVAVVIVGTFYNFIVRIGLDRIIDTLNTLSQIG